MNSEEKYHEAFLKECRSSYPEVQAFEDRCGFAVNVDKLQSAARVLACPLKVNPPSWAHGRVIYSAVRKLLAIDASAGVFLDIGTAKGFSAVAAGWAIEDSKASHTVLSVDIVDPTLKVSRNSVIETHNALFTVAEFVAPFRSSSVAMKFFGGGSMPLIQHLQDSQQRVRFAFVDGKHTYEAVVAEIGHLKDLQRSGDVTVLDDLQIAPVAQAASKLRGYDVTMLSAGPLRRYAVAVRQ